MKSLFFAFLTMLGFAFVAKPASADEPAPPHKVSVIGTAIIHVVPDQMDWCVQVGINDATLAKAKARHDTSLTAALAYIKSLGGAVQELQTDGVRFDRVYDPGDSSFLKKNPFSCTTQFTFTLTDFDQYGPITDALAKFDGVQVQSVSYSSSKEAATRREALKRALQEGQSKASDLAETAGCRIDKPLSIDEAETYSPMPAGMMNTMAVSRASADYAPGAVAGQIEFSAKVNVSYELLAK
jgi:uncharacterized protein YggE